MFGQPLRHLGETGSTNDDAMQWAREDAPHGSVVRADAQTRGRGRLGRTWSSPPSLGLYFSIVLRPQIEMTQVHHLTMLAALASARAVEEATQWRAAVKWPNDIILHGRKIGGVLAEAQAGENGHVEFAVVGIGLNVNFQASDLPHDVKIPATSLRMETGDVASADAVFASVLRALHQNYEQYASGGWDELRREFERRDILQGRRVRVESGRDGYAGTVSGLDESGTLQILTPHGLRLVVAGDVRLDDE